jgi:hypothetical protein
VFLACDYIPILFLADGFSCLLGVLPTVIYTLFSLEDFASSELLRFFWSLVVCLELLIEERDFEREPE